jgi:hypothetical protein
VYIPRLLLSPIVPMLTGYVQRMSPPLQKEYLKHEDGMAALEEQRRRCRP